jgi:redox-sensitive bicupin YhaK (pirin superfamily)
MTQALAPARPATPETAPRRIAYRTRGQSHGPITRLMSPGDLGEVLKPFVFLDIFDMEDVAYSGPSLHPHSGIATVTHLFDGAIRYEDTTGAQGELPAGGVEWFKAGRGAWHGGGVGKDGRARGFQLWMALPPAHELGEVESIYQSPDDVPRVGAAWVLVGAHAGAASALQAPSGANYLAVRLKAGETWRYDTPAGHTVGWLAVSRGNLATPEPINKGAHIDEGELVVFEPNDGRVEVYALSDVDFVLGSAEPHPHDLVLGYYSVHTSDAALVAGERNIMAVRGQLTDAGRL